MIRPATLRAGCAQAAEIATVSISATAINGAGKQSATPAAIVSSYGPDIIRVATFNLYQPGGHADSVYERWGRELASLADIVVLTEVPDLRRANLVAQQSGLSHVAMMTGQTDLAVLSRGALREPQERILDQPGRLATNDSNVFTVLSDLGRFPHRIIANHWGIRDADQLLRPNQSSSGRLMAANAVIDLAGPPGDALTFVAGDMNAFGGAGPQDHDDDPNTPDWVGSTIEMGLLLARFDDPFTILGARDPYCSNKRIDFVLAQGSYIPVSYRACFNEASPSDHPFVIVRFEAGDR